MTFGTARQDNRLGGWIWKCNLKPFLALAASALEVRIDDDEWEAIHYGLQGTSDIDDRWFDYELTGGQIRVRIALALDEGGATDIVLVRMDRDFDPVVEARIETLFSVCSSYDVSEHDLCSK